MLSFTSEPASPVKDSSENPSAEFPLPDETVVAQDSCEDPDSLGIPDLDLAKLGVTTNADESANDELGEAFLLNNIPPIELPDDISDQKGFEETQLDDILDTTFLSDDNLGDDGGAQSSDEEVDEEEEEFQEWMTKREAEKKEQATKPHDLDLHKETQRLIRSKCCSCWSL